MKKAWTITAAAPEFGITRETLVRRLAQAGVKEAKYYSTLQIHSALAGDLRFEQARLARANAESQELTNRKDAESLVSLQEVEKLLTETVTHPYRTLLLNLPSTMAARCNPTDPVLAQTALQEWVDNEALKTLREKLK